MLVSVCGSATAQSGTDVTVNEEDGTVTYTPKGTPALTTAAVKAFWTGERMAAAQPMPIPTWIVTETEASRPAVVEQRLGIPGRVDGRRPRTGPFVEKQLWFPEQQQAAEAPQTFGTAPTDPLNGPYGPFQRWSLDHPYSTWPRSIIGILFFTMYEMNFYCTATVIGPSIIATAGHCVAGGDGYTSASNLFFCPSYGEQGVDTSLGCWAASSATTSSGWFQNGDPDYDYACAVLQPHGALIHDRVGNWTGWAGYAFNFETNIMEVTVGYPGAPPFSFPPSIQLTAGPEWYDWDAIPGGQVSKVLGSDLTGGCSGGGWFMGWRTPSPEVADSDGKTYTDAGGAGPYLNGINSHKRCVGDCMSPPTASAGLFWQEMMSPPFRNTAAAGESTDVFAVCIRGQGPIRGYHRGIPRAHQEDR